MIEPIFCSLSNAYLIHNNGRNVLIDTGMVWDGKSILNFLKKRVVQLDLIFLTHAHPDHYGACRDIQESTGALMVIHHEDEELLRSGKIILGKTKGIGKFMKIFAWVLNRFPYRKIPEPNILVHDGDSLSTFGIDAEVIHTPGHTPGSSSLLFSDGSIFVGDLASSTGDPHVQKYFAQDWSILESSIKKIMKRKPRLIYPGHGHNIIEGKLLDRMMDNSFQ